MLTQTSDINYQMFKIIRVDIKNGTNTQISDESTKMQRSKSNKQKQESKRGQVFLYWFGKYFCLHPLYSFLLVVFFPGYSQFYQIWPQHSGSQIYNVVSRVCLRKEIRVKKKMQSLNPSEDPSLVAVGPVFIEKLASSPGGPG